MRKDRDSFLLSSNRARIGVENKDSGRSTITKIDVIEAAKAYFQTFQLDSVLACQLACMPAGRRFDHIVLGSPLCLDLPIPSFIND
jgi:hypothetical protein